MKYTLRFFGFPIFSVEREGDSELERFISNSGGQFEICFEDTESEQEGDYYEEEDQGFGFVRRT